MHGAESASSEECVAAYPGLGAFVDEEDVVRAGCGGRERGAKAGVSGADYEDGVVGF